MYWIIVSCIFFRCFLHFLTFFGGLSQEQANEYCQLVELSAIFVYENTIPGIPYQLTTTPIYPCLYIMFLDADNM